MAYQNGSIDGYDDHTGFGGGSLFGSLGIGAYQTYDGPLAIAGWREPLGGSSQPVEETNRVPVRPLLTFTNPVSGANPTGVTGSENLTSNVSASVPASSSADTGAAAATPAAAVTGEVPIPPVTLATALPNWATWAIAAVVIFFIWKWTK